VVGLAEMGDPHARGVRPPRGLAAVRERAGLLRLGRERGLAAALERGGCSRRSFFRWQRRTPQASPPRWCPSDAGIEGPFFI